MCKNQTSVKVIYAFLPLVIVTGFIQLLVPSTLHMIMKHYSLEPSKAGIIPLIYFTGILISTLSLTHIIRLLSIKQLISTGAIIVSLCLILSSQINNYYIFIILYFFVGAGNGLLMVLPGLYSTHVYGKKGAKFQSLIFTFLAAGFIIGPIFPGIITFAGIAWQWCFIIPGLLILPTLIPILLSYHQPIDHATPLTITTIREIVKFDGRFFYGAITIIALSAGASTGLLTWLITFLENYRGTDVGMAHVILASMGLSAVIGRSIWGKLSNKISCYKTLVIIAPISTIMVIIAPLPEKSIYNIILFFVSMIFLSGINPLGLAAAGVYPQSHSSSAYSLFFSFGAVGGILIPFAIGIIFQHTNPVIGMSSISIVLLLILITLLIIKKELQYVRNLNNCPIP